MPGCVAPLPKPGAGRRPPLALDPQKSEAVLAVLAERNRAVAAVGAWVEPAGPGSWQVPAHTSACMVEEELKEQLRKKQEALENFQRKVKYRVNQQIKLRKRHQFQKSWEAAEKEGYIVMQSAGPANLTPKRTSVFPNTPNVAIGTARLPTSQMFGSEAEDTENQDELFQQQAQALIQSKKQARHRLASFKTVNQKNISKSTDHGSLSLQEMPLYRKPEAVTINIRTKGELLDKACQRCSAPLHTEKSIENQEPGSHLSSAMIVEKGKENMFWRDQQSFPSEDKNIPFHGVQKVQFKNPVFAVMGEENMQQSNLQNFLPTDQDGPSEFHGDLQTQDDMTESLSAELVAQDIEPQGHGIKPKAQAIEQEAQNSETRMQEQVLEAQSIATRKRRIVLRGEHGVPHTQDFLPRDQEFPSEDQVSLTKQQTILSTCHDQDFLPRDQEFPSEDQVSLAKHQTILSTCHDQDFLPKDEKTSLKQPSSILIGGRGEQEMFPLGVHQDFLHQSGDQAFIRDKKVRFKESYSDRTKEKEREDFFLTGYQHLPLQLQDQAYIRDKVEQNKKEHRTNCVAFDNMPDERWREELFPDYHQDALRAMQAPASAREQNLYFWQQPSVDTTERQTEDLPLEGHHLPPKHHRVASSTKRVRAEYQLGLSTEFHSLPTFESGVDQEEDKKERQRQYLRYRRLFMDIERGQVKEQQRQREHKKKIEKIKKKKEQQRFAEEQRLLRMKCPEDPYSVDKMSEILAQLHMEEMKETREKQEQREKEYQRYLQALRAQIQEKMQLYNIALPPLCYCGPEFWDAHPDTCANNCVFYKNHKAYTQALHSVINSCDIPEGNSTLRIIISQFASAHRRTLKNL